MNDLNKIGFGIMLGSLCSLILNIFVLRENYPIVLFPHLAIVIIGAIMYQYGRED